MSATIEILIYRGDKLLGKREFQGELVTIGTAADSSLRFVGVPGVAEHHAMAWVENGGLTVAPSGGMPILWNGAPVSVARPTQADFVSVGPLRLQMRLHGAAAVAVAPPPAPASPPRAPRHEEEEDEPRTLVVAQSAVRRTPGTVTPQAGGLAGEGGIDKLLGMLEMELAGTRPYVALPDGSPALERVEARATAGDFEETTMRTSSPGRPAAASARIEESVPAPRGRQEPVFFPIGVDPHGPTAVAAAPRAPAPPPAAPPPPAPVQMMPAPAPVMPAPAPAPKASKPSKAARASIPADEPAPRRQRRVPTERVPAIAPPPDASVLAHDHDDDDHEEDEATFPEPFSMLEQISADAGVAGGELALQVTVVRNRRLNSYVTLDRGGHFTPFHMGRAVVRHRGDGRAELATSPQRTIRLRQSPSDPAQEVEASAGAAVFAPGGSAIVRDSGTDLVISFIRRPLLGKERAGSNTTVGATYGGGSLVVHMTVALVLTIMFGQSASLRSAAEAQLGQEPPDIEVGVTPPEPPPPPPPEAPTPEAVPTPTATPLTPMPNARTTVRRNVPNNTPPTDQPPPPSAAEEAMAALERMSSASSSSTLREAIGSIDAAASSGGASAVFRVAGPVGQLPGGAIRIGRAGGGGGGPIETRDLNQVTKGGAIGGVGPVQGTRNVRGRVSGAGSRLGGQGSIDRAAVQRVILSHQGQIAACYERALLRDPTLAGRVVMAWSITPSGGVGNVSVGQSSLSNSAVTSCISAAIRGWRFPQPSGGSVTVTFPYVFRPVGL
jgi:hypothetical protein